MFTVKTTGYDNQLEDAIQFALQWKQNIEKSYKVLRTKVEKLLSLNALDILSNEEYFETHLKVQLNSDEHKDKLVSIIKKYHHVAHSTNGTKFTDLNEYPREILVTLRRYNISIEDNFDEIEIVKKDLVENGFVICNIHREKVVYDDNVELDNGWLENDDVNVNVKEKEMVKNEFDGRVDDVNVNMKEKVKVKNEFDGRVKKFEFNGKFWIGSIVLLIVFCVLLQYLMS